MYSERKHPIPNMISRWKMALMAASLIGEHVKEIRYISVLYRENRRKWQSVYGSGCNYNTDRFSLNYIDQPKISSLLQDKNDSHGLETINTKKTMEISVWSQSVWGPLRFIITRTAGYNKLVNIGQQQVLSTERERERGAHLFFTRQMA